VVHFPALDAGLEKVALFRRHSRSASVLLPIDDQTETETELEAERDMILRWGGAVANLSPRTPSPFARHALGAEWGYALYTPDVPRTSDARSMVLLETMWLAGVGAVRLSSAFSLS
jgi:hypothetical protein